MIIAKKWYKIYIFVVLSTLNIVFSTLYARNAVNFAARFLILTKFSNLKD